MGDLDDFQEFDKRLQTELSKLDQFDERDQPHVQRFVRKLDGRVKTSTLAEYLKNVRSNAKRLDRPVVELDEDAFDQFIFELRHDEDYGRGEEPGFKDGTVRNYQFVLRKFLTTIDNHVDRDLSWAEDIELVKPADNTVSPEDLLRDEDIAALCEGANNLRDIAMIEFLADTGARLSLVGSLRVGDVRLEGDRPTYRPNPEASGLKGADIREYPIIDAQATLRTYLNRLHPRPDRDDVALFHAVPGHGNDFDESNGAISPRTVRQQLRRCAKNGGVDKPVNPHNFRHSAISRMRREGWDRAEVEHRVHWRVDSDMWRIYEHISAEEHNDAIWERVGVDADEEDSEEPERRPCGNCRETVAPHHEYCPRCGEALTPDARQLRREATTEASKLIGDGEGDITVSTSTLVELIANGEIAPGVDGHD